MSIITKVPVDYRKTVLYQRLTKVSLVNEDGLKDKVDRLIHLIEPVLQTIGKNAFSNYTLHDSLHSLKLLHLASFIIPKGVINSLSSLELTVMIMSFYLHDLGMVLLDSEKDDILKSEKFQSFIELDDSFSARIKSLRQDIDKATDERKTELEGLLSQLQEVALTNYLRPKHADISRYGNILNTVLGSDNDDIFFLNGFSFKNELLRICNSHNETCFLLSKSDSNGNMLFGVDRVICGQELNMQYCAAILRIADILDFDFERTPMSLYKAIGLEDKQLPGFKVSLNEWRKQMSIHTIKLCENEIVISADCQSPSIEHSIREMCKTIEKEICETFSIIRSVRKEITERYYITIPQNIRVDIRSIGYTYKDYYIRLNDSAIKNLLMGNNLYSKKICSSQRINTKLN